MYIRWLIFSCNFGSLYPSVHFLSMWMSGIIAIINSNGDSASPRNIPLWIDTRLTEWNNQIKKKLWWLFHFTWIFHTQGSWWSFTGDWRTASLQVSRTFLSILTDLRNDVVSMGANLPQISDSSSFSSHGEIVQNVTTIHISLFSVLWQGPSICQSLSFLWFPLCVPPKTLKSTRRQTLLLLINIRTVLQAGTKCSICISVNHSHHIKL